MLAAGLKPVALTRDDDPVPAGHFGYVFSGSDLNTSVWTARGLVSAGAFSDFDWSRKRSNPKTYREKMRIFEVTRPMLRAVLLIRRGMSPELRAGLIRALVQYGNSMDVAALQATYYDVGQFVPIGQKNNRELDESRSLYRAVRPYFD